MILRQIEPLHFPKTLDDTTQAVWKTCCLFLLLIFFTLVSLAPIDFHLVECFLFVKLVGYVLWCQIDIVVGSKWKFQYRVNNPFMEEYWASSSKLQYYFTSIWAAVPEESHFTQRVEQPPVAHRVLLIKSFHSLLCHILHFC